MGTIFPQGEQLRRAIRWISDQVKSENKHPKNFVAKADTKFCLTPIQGKFLVEFYNNASS